MNWALLKNSLLVSGGATLLALALGVVAALWLSTREAPWQRRLLGCAVVALVLPPFLVTNCWLELLGARGRWRGWLPLDLCSPAGAAWLLALLTWPIPLLLVWAAWRRVEPSQLEADPALRGWGLLRWLLWPMARPAVGQAAVVTFVLALNNFAVPVILQVRVFPEEMWLAFTTRLDEAAAWLASAPLVMAPLVLLLALRRAEFHWPRLEGPAAARALRRQLGRGWLRASGLLTLALLALSVGLPLGQLLATARTWTELPNVLRAAPGVIGNSFAFAVAAASLGVALGLLTARWRVGLVVWLPFLAPGILLARALLQAFSGTVLYGTVSLVVLAFTLRYLALGWHGAARALRSVDADLVDAARLEGARGWTLFRLACWPQTAPSLAAAWYVVYLLCLWDVETLVLLQPPGGETLALRIFNLLHYGHSAHVNALCVTLLAVAVAPLAVWLFSARWRAPREE